MRNRKEYAMYEWETDKNFINLAYRESADLVNRLVQNLKKYDIEAGMKIAGSKSGNMILKNGKSGIDFDFNLEIKNTPSWKGKFIKKTIIKAFNEVLNKDGLNNCEDSTSVISSKEIELMGINNTTPFKIDICIVRKRLINNAITVERLIHNKTGNEKSDTYIWNIAYKGSKEFDKKVIRLKNKGYWDEVRECYKDFRNMYLREKDDNHPAYVCYIQAVNQVYNSYYDI